MKLTLPNHMLKCSTLAAAILTTLGTAMGAVTFTENSTTGTITLAFDETYSITTSSTSDHWYVSFQDVWTTEDGEVSALESVDSSVQFSLNGAPLAAATLWTGWQFRPGNQGVHSNFDAAALIADTGLPPFGDGDSLRLVGSLEFSPSNRVRLPDRPAGTVDTFFANGTTPVSQTNTTQFNATPEPGVALLTSLAVAISTLGGRRRAR